MYGFIKSAFLVMVLCIGISADEKIPTVHELLDTSGLKIDYNEIDSGKIVSFAREDQERTDT